MRRTYIVTIPEPPSFDLSLREIKEAIREAMADNFGIEEGVTVDEDEE